ncbi:MAG: hypothetical protein LBD41_01615 [Clostridiales Family XIII bacterium]|jgi:hypothetical protein|nr:hypothetical protein [Clostridiales Family XIII bacterium]
MVKIDNEILILAFEESRKILKDVEEVAKKENEFNEKKVDTGKNKNYFQKRERR